MIEDHLGCVLPVVLEFAILRRREHVVARIGHCEEDATVFSRNGPVRLVARYSVRESGMANEPVLGRQTCSHAGIAPASQLASSLPATSGLQFLEWNQKIIPACFEPSAMSGIRHIMGSGEEWLPHDCQKRL
jgi:hypothetical protein